MQKTNGSGLRLLFIRMLVRMRLFGECYYINGPDTLPPPLKKEEEQAAVSYTHLDVYKRQESACLLIHSYPPSFFSL